MRAEKRIDTPWRVWQLPEEQKTGYLSEKAASVHEILMANGVLDERVLLGECKSCQWVSESDWLYRTVFTRPFAEEGRVVLSCGHVDTVADFYLNGTWIGHHDDSYLPFTAEVSDLIQDENTLEIRFRSPFAEVRERAEKIPSEWPAELSLTTLVRKPNSTFGSFLGAKPYLATMGLAAPVVLTRYDEASLSDLCVRTHLSYALDRAEITVIPEVEGMAAHTEVEVCVTSPEGTLLASKKKKVEIDANVSITIDAPKLWWPHTFGEQPLYEVTCRLLKNGEVLDARSRKIGIRSLECNGNFDVKINHQPVRLWGANFVNLSALTQGWDHERGERVLKQAKTCGFNILRTWGEAPSLDDAFYDYCDENGILIWQDFYIGYGLWPDRPEDLKIYQKEAEFMVKRLRNHPSLLLWCGSNESYMFGLAGSGKPQTTGFDIVLKVVKKVCQELDPDRYYHFSSPSGGAYPQDPREGDIHGYNRINFEPGSSYPVLFSEYCHLTPLASHSMKKIMTEEELFPEGYTNRQVYDPSRYLSHPDPDKSTMISSNYWRTLPVPETWKKHLSAFQPADVGSITDYYDAENGEDLLYRFSACAMDDTRAAIERARRGRPSGRPGPRICRGLLVWKYNDIIPHMNFTLLDAYTEPTCEYYAVKRAFQPLMVSLHRQEDHIYLWAVNDSRSDFKGKIVLRVFSRLQIKIVRKHVIPVEIRAGESVEITDLDFLGPIHLECLVHAQLCDGKGEIFNSAILSLDKECNLPFPDAKLSLEVTGKVLTVKTDQYARHIVLSGDDEGDAFGWDFEDNYFDLLPYEEKEVRILGRHTRGIIRAKAHYSSVEAWVEYDPGK